MHSFITCFQKTRGIAWSLINLGRKDELPTASWEHEGGESTPPKQASLEQLGESLGWRTFAGEFVVEGDLPVYKEEQQSPQISKIYHKMHIIYTRWRTTQKGFSSCLIKIFNPVQMVKHHRLWNSSLFFFSYVPALKAHYLKVTHQAMTSSSSWLCLYAKMFVPYYLGQWHISCTWLTKLSSSSNFSTAIAIWTPKLSPFIGSIATAWARDCWSLSIPWERASSACCDECCRLPTSKICWSVKGSICGKRTWMREQM